MRQESRWRRRSRQDEFVYEHRFIRTAHNPNRTFTIKKIWINTGFDNLRRLRASPNRTFTIKKMWINTGFDNLRRLRANIKL
uniref:Transposase n=1 Tax=Angiostrongylus cantonensis TaxID=6313 RepID=A0A0K0D6I2_ANGCA